MNNTLLRELNERLATIALVPSSKETIKIKPISIKQIKNVVDKSLETSYFDIGFKQAVTNVLKENILSDIDVTLTEADISVLFVYLKTGGNFKGQKVNDIISQLANSINDINVKKTLTIDSIQIELSSPSISRLEQLETLLIKNIKTDDENNLVNEQEVGTLYFIIEILKHVSSLKINDTELIDGKSIDEQMSIIQELPYQVANEVVKFSQDLQSTLRKTLSYNDIEIPFDISFFE